jgi:hypothetical protein
MSGFFMLTQNDSDMVPHATAESSQWQPPYQYRTPMPKNVHTLQNEEDGARKRQKTGTKELDKLRGSIGLQSAIAEEVIHAKGKGKGKNTGQARLRGQVRRQHWMQEHATELETMNRVEQEAHSIKGKLPEWWHAREDAGNAALEMVKANASRIQSMLWAVYRAQKAFEMVEKSGNTERINMAQKKLNDVVTVAANQERSPLALQLNRARGAFSTAKHMLKQLERDKFTERIKAAETFVNVKQEALDELEQMIKYEGVRVET